MITGHEIATAQVSEDKSGFLGVQVDGLGTGAALATFPLHHAYGFRSRPRDPAPNGDGCQVLTGFEGTRGHAWLLEDPRYAGAPPATKLGGAIQYAITPAGLAAYLDLDGDDGSAKLHVPDAAQAIRFEHGDSGPSIEVNNAFVEAGGPGGKFVVVDSGALTAWVAAVTSALAGLGVVVPSPGVITATKVKAL